MSSSGLCKGGIETQYLKEYFGEKIFKLIENYSNNNICVSCKSQIIFLMDKKKTKKNIIYLHCGHILCSNCVASQITICSVCNELQEHVSIYLYIFAIYRNF